MLPVLPLDEFIRQGVRYLRASAQDTHPVYGLTHASYARLIFEGLALKGVPIGNLLRQAGDLQDRWGKKVVEHFPFKNGV